MWSEVKLWKSFDNSVSIALHQKAHTREKPFEFQQFDKLFSRLTFVPLNKVSRHTMDNRIVELAQTNRL